MSEQVAQLELVSTRLPRPLAAKVRAIAAREDRSISSVTRRLLTRALEGMEERAETTTA